MAIIKIIPNKPLIVNLMYPSAKEKQCRAGIDFMYTLQGGHALFVPPIAHDEIQKLHAGPGEPFTLTKTIGQGNQAVWKVERMSAPVPTPERPAMSTPKAAANNQPIAPKSITNGRVAVMPARRRPWPRLNRKPSSGN
jgi:hypothetical protein